MWEYMQPYHGGGGWFGGLFMLALWVFAIVGVVALVKGLASRPPANRARAILEERYARGEIDREEFEARKRDLSSG